MDKLLTVIIPSCNMEKYLPRCLGSLIAAGPEHLSKLDAIVVNDGSRDRTGEIAHEFERRHPDSVRVIDKPNGHYGSAVNAGLAAATGLCVKILDADDTFDPKGLATLLGQIESDARGDRAVDLYLTDYDHVDERGKTLQALSCDLPIGRVFGLDEVIAKTGHVCMHAFAWRTQLLRDAGYRQTEGIPYSDWEWILYPMLEARTIRYLPTRVYLYLLGRVGQSVSATERRKNAGAWVILLNRAFAACRTQADRLPPAARSYLLRVTVGMAQMLSETAFLMNPIRDLEPVVSRLSADLESIQPGLAGRLEDVSRVMKGTLNVPYLRIWRRLPFGKTPWVRLIRGYLAVVHRVRR